MLQSPEQQYSVAVFTAAVAEELFFRAGLQTGLGRALLMSAPGPETHILGMPSLVSQWQYPRESEHVSFSIPFSALLLSVCVHSSTQHVLTPHPLSHSQTGFLPAFSPCSQVAAALLTAAIAGSLFYVSSAGSGESFSRSDRRSSWVDSGCGRN